jgi:hypothetical protein
MDGLLPSVIEENTELYDLFGEEGFCTVCQETLKEGERIRSIVKCQHLFHAVCLDPWLKNNTSCPICRVEIYKQSANRNIIRNLLEILEERISLQRTEFARNLLTWTVWEGVLRKCRNAVEFTTYLGSIQYYLQEHPVIINNVEIKAVVVRNRTALTKEIAKLRDLVRIDTQPLSIRSWETTTQLRAQITTFADEHADFKNIWI